MRYTNNKITGKLCYVLLLVLLVAGCAAPGPPRPQPPPRLNPRQRRRLNLRHPPTKKTTPIARNDLFEAIDALKAATAGQSAPDGAKYAYMTNNTSPFAGPRPRLAWKQHQRTWGCRLPFNRPLGQIC